MNGRTVGSSAKNGPYLGASVVKRFLATVILDFLVDDCLKVLVTNLFAAYTISRFSCIVGILPASALKA